MIIKEINNLNLNKIFNNFCFSQILIFYKQLGQIIEKVPVRFPNEIAISEMSKDFIRKCLTVDEN